MTTFVYCVGQCSYDERVALPYGVYSTLEKAQASVKLRPGEEWKRLRDGEEWSVDRPGAEVELLIARFEVDAHA